MTADEIRNTTIDVVVEMLNLHKNRVTSEAHLINDLGMDSLDSVEMIMELEDRFDIAIKDDEAEKIVTVQGLTEFMVKTVAEFHGE
jgi:acyl carrier protein